MNTGAPHPFPRPSHTAAPMIGGLITSMVLTLAVVPAIYSLWRGRQIQWKPVPPPPKKTWDALSAQFVAMEQETARNP